MIALPAQRRWLMDIAREAGDRYFNPSTGRCVITRDTYWYAIALLFDQDAERRQFGGRLIATLEPEDATHTPATLLSILHRIPDMIDAAATARLDQAICGALGTSALCELHDGNVNHPLAAYATLILGGERCGAAWATDMGTARLQAFRQRIGDHRIFGIRAQVFEVFYCHCRFFTGILGGGDRNDHHAGLVRPSNQFQPGAVQGFAGRGKCLAAAEDHIPFHRLT